MFACSTRQSNSPRDRLYDIGSLAASSSTKRRMDNETAADTGLSFQDEIKREMIEIKDQLTNDTDGRFQHKVSKRLVCILAGDQPVRTSKRRTDGDTNK